MAFYDKRIRDLLTYKIFINCDGKSRLIQMILGFVGGWSVILQRGAGLWSVCWNSTTSLSKMPSGTSSILPLSMLISLSLASGTTEFQLISLCSISRIWLEGSLLRKRQSRPKLSYSDNQRSMTLRLPIHMMSRCPCSKNPSWCSQLHRSTKKSWSSSWPACSPRYSRSSTSTKSTSSNSWRCWRCCCVSW